MDISKVNRVLVVGLGSRSGLSACNFLAAEGKSVFVSDRKVRGELEDIIKQLDPRAVFIDSPQDPGILEGNFDLIVLSPGVPASIPLISEAVRKKIPVISEIELAAYYIRGGIIAVTGTDGKTTTTSLVSHILKFCGLRVLTGGNIGIPAISFAASSDESSAVVLELSSFQLETIESFRPDISAVLNVTPDHLDRYSGMESYFAAKMRIAMNQTAGDYIVYNADDSRIAAYVKSLPLKKLSFSLRDGNADAYSDGERIFTGGIELLRMSDAKLMGIHNAMNIMAAFLVCRAYLEKKGISPDIPAMKKACLSFEGLPHRMEKAGEIEGRIFINDSKATTIGSVEMAVKSLRGPGILILGGRTKGDDYSRLLDITRNRIKSFIFIGESAPLFAGIFRDADHHLSRDLRHAVITSMKISAPGDTVLLSPACASFDMFRNYEERGDVFKQIVGELAAGKLKWK